jgi:integrase
MPYNNAPVDSLERAARMLRQAADELDAEIHARALATAQKRAGYDPAAVLVDSLGRKRSPATVPGYMAGRSPANKGRRFPATPPTVPEILQLLEHVGDVSKDERYAERLRAFVMLAWRAGLRCSEALALHEADLNPTTGEVFVRRGKGGKARTVGLDDWLWPVLEPWMGIRHELPPGPLLCVIEGRSKGIAPWCGSSVRDKMAQLAKAAGVRKRCAPHQLRHAVTVEMVMDGQNIVVIQRMLGHSSLAVTTTYTQGLPTSTVVDAMRRRTMPTVPAFGG